MHLQSLTVSEKLKIIQKVEKSEIKLLVENMLMKAVLEIGERIKNLWCKTVVVKMAFHGHKVKYSEIQENLCKYMRSDSSDV